MDFEPIIAFEQQHIHYRTAPATPTQGIQVRSGAVPILFSAPHAARHKRNERWKQEDEYTGAIAEWLHQLTQGHALYVSHQIDPDPHDDGDQNLYKQQLAAIVKAHSIKLVVDLHGVRGDRDFGVGLGTMHGVSCEPYEQFIIDHFEAVGFLRQNFESSLDRLAINPPRYTGGLSRPTITRFAHQQLHVPAIQMEINAWIRVLKRLPHSTNALSRTAPDFYGDRERFVRFITALSKLANGI